MKLARIILMSALVVGTSSMVALAQENGGGGWQGQHGQDDRDNNQRARRDGDKDRDHARRDASHGRSTDRNGSRDRDWNRDRTDDQARNRTYSRDRRTGGGDNDRDDNGNYRNGQYGNGGYGNDGRYENGRYGSMGQGRQLGFQDGINDGAKDRQTGHSFRPTQDDNYQHGDRGYNSALGDKNQYKQIYRDAYTSGYQQGYYSNGR